MRTRQARRFVLIEGGGEADRCVTQPFPAGGLGALQASEARQGERILATIY